MAGHAAPSFLVLVFIQHKATVETNLFIWIFRSRVFTFRFRRKARKILKTAVEERREASRVISTKEIHNGEGWHDAKLPTPKKIRENVSFLRNSWPKQPEFWYRPAWLPALGRGSHWESQWPQQVLGKLSWWWLGGWELSGLPVWPAGCPVPRKESELDRLEHPILRARTGQVRVPSFGWEPELG